MNKELQAIENSITQWTFYAETRAEAKSSYPPLKDLFLINSCYLCQYSCEKSGTKNTSKNAPDSACHACPYYKKYGFCDMTGKPYYEWCWGNKAQGAQAFLEQLKVLAYEAQHPEPKKAEKPKLRHGDYGRDLDGFIYLEDNIRHKSIVHWLGDYGESGLSGRAAESFEGKVIGNLADDLAALKPLEEFEMKDCTGGNDFKARINCNCTDGHVELRAGCGLVTVNDREFHEIILKLRCMELQMKLDAK